MNNQISSIMCLSSQEQFRELSYRLPCVCNKRGLKSSKMLFVYVHGLIKIFICLDTILLHVAHCS